jgi:glycosyltransferase involved in cell wall biosynthesis
LPVVAIARGGIPEAVDHGKNGVLVNDLESGAFSSAVARLLGRPEEAARMGQAARETAIARFSANQMVGQTIRLYESLIAAGSRV